MPCAIAKRLSALGRKEKGINKEIRVIRSLEISRNNAEVGLLSQISYYFEWPFSPRFVVGCLKTQDVAVGLK